ncbi:MAG: structural protein P5 [Alistipes sp.]|nr:structural protein P5 [Alistipes sp.]
MSRGLSNNNPGNIRRGGGHFKGERLPSLDPAFKQFETIEWGYRAMFVLLDNYRRRHGLQSIREMIRRWAPPVENDTERYIRFVARAASLDPDQPIDTRNRRMMIPIVAAMSRIENGVPARLSEVEGGWQLFLKDKKGCP